MVFKDVSVVEQRLAMVKAVLEDGMTVVDACRLWEISRDRFYYWRNRYLAEGVDGLSDRSSRPIHSPGQISRHLEATIVDLRKAHKRWGARRIRAELKRRDVTELASASTIHAALKRNGLVDSAEKEPAATKSFERDWPGELVQTDAKDVVLATRQKVHVFSLLDDHSRLLMAAEARQHIEAQDAIASFDIAIARYGLPYSVLNDRGSCFTGITTKTVGAFERHLWGYGVFTINGRPYHPQTQGKIERYHRTLGEWLEDDGPYDSIKELQRSLDEFRDDYNLNRPHQGIDDMTPFERWSATPMKHADPDGTAHRRVRSSIRRTFNNGNLTYGEWSIGLGRARANSSVKVVDYGHVIEIRDENDDLIRKLEPDPNRRYLPSGKPRGRSLKKTT